MKKLLGDVAASTLAAARRRANPDAVKLALSTGRWRR